MEDAKIFKKKLASCIRELATIDPVEKAGILGLQKRGDDMVFDFFNRRIHMVSPDFEDASGQNITDALKFVFCNYLLKCPDHVVKSQNRLVSFREFNNAGPLFSRFTSNTAQIIESSFAGKISLLKQKCRRLGGSVIDRSGYDIGFRFRALHRIPIILYFNDAEDSLPASAVFLFHDNAESFLDLECMTIITTYLTGQLIQNN